MNILTNHYMSQTGMHSDTYATGKLYAKLDAYVQNGKGNEFFYLSSSNQFKTQRRFKAWLRERHSFRDDAIITIVKGD